jgi:hypothetical protein
MNDDAHAIGEIAAMSDMDVPQSVSHYLYAPSNEAASDVALELQQRGFRTEVRRDAYGVNWLILASHEIVLTEELLRSIRNDMETLTAKVGGEYDGWEANVRRDRGDVE